MAARRVRRPARPRRQAPPRRAGPRRRGARRRPRGRLRLHRRRQDRPRRPATPGRSSSPTGRRSGCGPRCTPATSASCAAPWSRRSAASTPSSRAPRTGTWCCKVTERARARRPRAPGPLPLADARDLGRGRRRSGEAVGVRGRAAGACRPTASGSACRRGSSATTALPGVYHLAARARAASRRSASSSRPTASGARSATRRSSLVEHCVRSIVETLDLRQLRDRLRRRRLDRRRRCSTSCAAIAGDRLRVVAYDRPVQLLGQDQPRRRAQRGRAPAAAQRRHGGDRRPDWIERMVMYSRSMPGSAPSAAACSGRTGASSTSASSSRTAGSRATPTAASRGDFTGYANNVLRRPELPRGHRRLPDDPRATLFEEVGGLSDRAPGQLQRRRLLPEAARARACGSSTTPTRSSTTSSPRAAPPRSRSGRRSRCSSAGCR